MKKKINKEIAIEFKGLDKVTNQLEKISKLSNQLKKELNKLHHMAISYQVKQKG